MICQRDHRPYYHFHCRSSISLNALKPEKLCDFSQMLKAKEIMRFLSNALKSEKLCGPRKTTLPQLQNSVNHRHSDPNDTEL
jgi:hypothetical protein